MDYDPYGSYLLLCSFMFFLVFVRFLLNALCITLCGLGDRHKNSFHIMVLRVNIAVAAASNMMQKKASSLKFYGKKVFDPTQLAAAFIHSMP